jgi:phosphotransferase system  glucose/maltose/N-acetylglucosamine-specific IIC component
MEMSGYLKVVIVFFALAVPISIAFMVWRTLFAGLNSISTTKRGNSPEDTAEAEQLQADQNNSADSKAG